MTIGDPGNPPVCPDSPWQVLAGGGWDGPNPPAVKGGHPDPPSIEPCPDPQWGTRGGWGEIYPFVEVRWPSYGTPGE